MLIRVWKVQLFPSNKVGLKENANPEAQIQTTHTKIKDTIQNTAPLYGYECLNQIFILFSFMFVRRKIQIMKTYKNNNNTIRKTVLFFAILLLPSH